MDLPLDIDCPQCGRTIKTTMQDVARGATKRCPGGHSVKLVDRNGGARKAQRSVADFDKSLKRLGFK